MLLILNGSLGVLFAVYFISLKITKKEGVSVINAIIGYLAAIIVFWAIAMFLGQNDYDVYLMNEQPLCAIEGEDTYIHLWDDSTYYIVTEDENGKHKYSIDSASAYIVENADSPVLKTYGRKYKDDRHWYIYVPKKMKSQIDHYEIYIPGTAQR